MIKKFGKLAQYKMYMKLMKEDNILDKPSDEESDILSKQDDEQFNDVHKIEEPQVNREEPGMFNSDNIDLVNIHIKLMSQFEPSQLIYDNNSIK